MSTVEEIREAAALMRSRAEAAAQPWHPWGDEKIPERSGPDAWRDDMRGYLGGEWAEHAAELTPDFALAMADLLDALADRAERRPAFLLTSIGAHARVVALHYAGKASQ